MKEKLILVSLMILYLLILPAKEKNSFSSGNFKINFPLEFGKWKGKEIELEEKVYSILGTRNVVYRLYENEKGQKIRILIIASVNNLTGFHPPEICYLGSDFEISERGYKQIGDIKVNRIEFSNRRIIEIVYYWFAVGGEFIGSYFKQQIRLLLNYLRSQEIPGYMFKISVITNSNKKQEGEKILEDFFKDFSQKLENSLT